MTTPPAKIRPLTRAQILENRAFLKALRRTGNVAQAARDVGFSKDRFKERRAKHPAFATAWAAAMVVAETKLKARFGDVGEGRIARSRTGRFQLRRRRPGSIGPDAEQTFLSALSATANIRLSAAAAGFSAVSFHNRARAHPGFAREMRLAIQMGAERLEAALIEGFAVRSHEDDAWRHNEPPAIPPMSAEQALLLLRYHHKRIIDQDEPPHIRRRRHEDSHAHAYRLGAMYEQRLQRMAEQADIEEAARQARGEEPRFEVRPVLPDLAQINARRCKSRQE